MIKEFTYVSFFDGSCEPVNPNGNIGIGVASYVCEDFVFKRDKGNKRIVKTFKKSIIPCFKYSNHIEYGSPGFEITTNNMAEHMALNYSLDFFARSSYKKAFFFGDSEFVIKQMIREYSINKGKPYYEYARKNLEIVLRCPDKEFNFQWIPRELNSEADFLSK